MADPVAERGSGGGGGGGEAPLIFRPNWGPTKGQKKFVLRPGPLLSQGLDDRHCRFWISKKPTGVRILLRASEWGSLRPLLYEETLSRVTCLPELPWASQLIKQFLTKRDEPFTWKTKSWPSYIASHSFAMVGSPSNKASMAKFFLYKRFLLPSWVNSVITAWTSAVLDNARVL